MESSGIFENVNTSHTYKDDNQITYNNLNTGMRERDSYEERLSHNDINIIDTHVNEINTNTRRRGQRAVKKDELQNSMERYLHRKATADGVHLKMEFFAKSSSFWGDSALLSDAKMKIGYFLESSRKAIDFTDNDEDNKVLLGRSIDVMMAYLSQAIDSCNVYLLNQANNKENTDTCRKVSDICKDMAYELAELNTQKNVIANGSFNLAPLKNRKVLASDFAVGEQTISERTVTKEADANNNVSYKVNGRECKVIAANNFHNAGRQSDIQLASVLGLRADDMATQYARYYDKGTKEDKILELPETGKTLADINQDGVMLDMSSKAHSKLQQIYLFDFLRGKKRNANNIKVSYIKMPIPGFDQFRYIVTDVKMTGEAEGIADEKNITKNDIWALSNESKERILKIGRKIEEGNSTFVNSLFHENATEEEKQRFQDRIQQICTAIESNEEATEQEAYRSLITVEQFTSYANDSHARDEWEAIESSMDATCAMAVAAKHKKGSGSGRAGRIFNKIRHIFSLPNRLVNLALMGARKLCNCFLPSNDKSFKSKTNNLQAVPGILHKHEVFDSQEEIKESIERGADDQEVMDDKRYMPLSFEKAIPDATDKPPYVTLKVNKGGHSFIEMSYTRLNKKTNKKQRYRVNFGFYPKVATSVLDDIAQAGSGLILPGTIKDEDNISYGRYDAGKRFRVTNKQINRIVAFTHDFEKGGYNVINRNCATFATEALKAGQIDSGDLFRKRNLNEVAYNAAGGASAVVPVTGMLAMGANMRYKRFGKVTDLAYQSFGQSLVSNEEYERLYSFHGTKLETYDPIFFAENIKKQTANHGDIISYDGLISIGNDAEGRPLVYSKMDVSTKIDKLEKVLDTFESLLREDVGNDIPADAINEKISVLRSKLVGIQKEGLNPEQNNIKSSTLIELKKTIEKNTKKVNDVISYCNELYNEFFHADTRVQEDMYFMVSTLNYLKEDFYSIYSRYELDSVRIAKQSDDMKTKAIVQNNISLSYENEDGQEVKSPNWSLRKVAAAMEIFRDSREYVDFASRYNRLVKMNAKTIEEEREFNKLKKRHQLLNSFERVHKMYFDSKAVTRELADIAFATMPLKEQEQIINIKWDNDAGKASVFRSSSQLYQNECFSKIFDQVWETDENGAVGIPDGITEATNKINEQIKSNDASITSQMEAIFRAVAHSCDITRHSESSSRMVSKVVYASLIKNYIWPSVAYEYETFNGQVSQEESRQINNGDYFFQDALRRRWINADLENTIRNKYNEMVRKDIGQWEVVNQEAPAQAEQEN